MVTFAQFESRYSSKDWWPSYLKHFQKLNLEQRMSVMEKPRETFSAFLLLPIDWWAFPVWDANIAHSREQLMSNFKYWQQIYEEMLEEQMDNVHPLPDGWSTTRAMLDGNNRGWVNVYRSNADEICLASQVYEVYKDSIDAVTPTGYTCIAKAVYVSWK